MISQIPPSLFTQKSEKELETKAPTTTAAVSKEMFSVQGMTCASCVARIEDAVSRVPGVLDISVNLLGERAAVLLDTARVTPAEVVACIESAGYRCRHLDHVGAKKVLLHIGVGRQKGVEGGGIFEAKFREAHILGGHCPLSLSLFGAVEYSRSRRNLKPLHD